MVLLFVFELPELFELVTNDGGKQSVIDGTSGVFCIGIVCCCIEAVVVSVGIGVNKNDANICLFELFELFIVSSSSSFNRLLF